MQTSSVSCAEFPSLSLSDDISVYVFPCNSKYPDAKLSYKRLSRMIVRHEAMMGRIQQGFMHDRWPRTIR